MKFTPKDVEAYNVNVSNVSPLKEAVALSVKLLLAFFVIYILFGLLTDFLVPRISLEVENKIANVFAESWGPLEASKDDPYYQDLLEKLIQHTDFLEKRNYKIKIIRSDEVNAFAFLGGNILVTDGLLKKINSENELAMILAHELGHFARRDHLKGMGRTLGLLVGSVVLFGSDGSVSRLVGNSMSLFQMRFSHQQELRADDFALDLVNKTYGHVGGAIDFFRQLSEEEKSFYFTTTHPHPKKRLAVLTDKISQRHYEIRELNSLINH